MRRVRTIAVCLLATLLAGSISVRAQEQPQRGGTLIFGVQAEPPNYDCHANTSFAFIHPVRPHYSTLLKFDPANYPAIVGDVAEGWEVSDDKLTYTFQLRPSVKFHDGSAMTSKDIEASYERIISPPEGVVSARQSAFTNVASIETPDEHTVVFKLSKPDASMLANFASPWNCIYSAAKLAEDPEFPETHILGTGPFRFVEHQAGSHWLGERFDNYFVERQPYLDGFRAVFMKGAAVVNALQGGQIAAEFRGFSPADRDKLVNALGDEVQVQEAPWLASIIIVFNTQKPPFDDPRVRKALSLAIDRWQGAHALSKISTLRHVGGIMRPGYEMALSDEELEKLPGFGRDMDAAREEAMRLLKEAGQENLTLKLTNRNVAEPYTPAGIYLIDQWRQIGVQVQHEQLETRLWQDAMSSGNFDVAVDFTGDFMDDPSLQFSKYLSAKASPVSYAEHNDAELDALYEKQKTAVDPAEREKIVREFERRALEQAYTVPLLWWHRAIVLGDEVKGWEITPSHYLNQDLATVWLSNE